MYEQNKEICRRLMEQAWGNGNLKAIDEAVSSKCRLHDPAFPDLGTGAESLKQHIRNLRQTFPDLSCNCDDIIAERDEVVVHWTCRGTNRGRFLNHPATNRSATISGTSIYRLESGKVVELWTDWNLQSLLDQLGLGMTEAESNKALVKRFLDELWNRKKPEMISQFVSGDVVFHTPHGTMRGTQEARKYYDTLSSAFPDCHAKLEEIACEGDRVMVRGTMTGTHTGQFLDIPASGKSISIPMMGLLRIKNGKIAEDYVVWDRFNLLQQIGALTEPAKAAKSMK